ncbi:MAG: 6,7-dimethyl-8-ribityllumazine synthase [Actinomycetota bacterium]
MNVSEIHPADEASELTVGLAVANFNQAITDRLLGGALTTLESRGIAEAMILRVAGAWELAVAASELISRGCGAVVAIGAVIRGDTDHYEVIVRESAAGLTKVALERRVPIGNAVLAAHDFDQAWDRSEPGPGNQGAEAAEAAVAAALAIRGQS